MKKLLIVIILLGVVIQFAFWAQGKSIIRPAQFKAEAMFTCLLENGDVLNVAETIDLEGGGDFDKPFPLSIVKMEAEFIFVNFFIGPDKSNERIMGLRQVFLGGARNRFHAVKGYFFNEGRGFSKIFHIEPGLKFINATFDFRHVGHNWDDIGKDMRSFYGGEGLGTFLGGLGGFLGDGDGVLHDFKLLLSNLGQFTSGPPQGKGENGNNDCGEGHDDISISSIQENLNKLALGVLLVLIAMVIGWLALWKMMRVEIEKLKLDLMRNALKKQLEDMESKDHIRYGFSSQEP